MELNVIPVLLCKSNKILPIFVQYKIQDFRHEKNINNSPSINYTNYCIFYVVYSEAES